MPDEHLHDETLAAAREALALAPRPTDGDLAETRARFQALRDGPRATVVPLAASSPRRRSRRPLVLAATAAVAAAAALAGVSLTGVLSFGPGEASASQRLANALSLKDAVVHYRTVGEIAGAQSVDGASTETIRITYEVWESAGARLTIADEGNGPIESSFGDGLWSLWSPSRNAIVSVPVTGDTSPVTIFGPSLAELVDGLRDGTLEAEPITLDGRQVLAVDGEQGRTLFDPDTYRPLEIQYPAGDRPVVYRYDLFEASERDDASLAALSLAARHPGARQVTDPQLYSQVVGELYPNG